MIPADTSAKDVLTDDPGANQEKASQFEDSSSEARADEPQASENTPLASSALHAEGQGKETPFEEDGGDAPANVNDAPLNLSAEGASDDSDSADLESPESSDGSPASTQAEEESHQSTESDSPAPAQLLDADSSAPEEQGEAADESSQDAPAAEISPRSTTTGGREMEPMSSQDMLQFFNELLDAMGVQGSVHIREDNGDQLTLDIRGCPDASLIIGRHGQTVDDLQYLGGLILNSSRRDRKRFLLNVENYRERREEVLRNSAIALANQVAEFAQEAVLDPLPPHERRIIHMALIDRTDVYTYSEGVEPDRYIVISPRAMSEKDNANASEALPNATSDESAVSVLSDTQADNEGDGAQTADDPNLEGQPGHTASDLAGTSGNVTSPVDTNVTAVEDSQQPDSGAGLPGTGSNSGSELDPGSQDTAAAVEQSIYRDATEFGEAVETPEDAGKSETGEMPVEATENPEDGSGLPETPPGGGSHSGHTGVEAGE